MPSTKLHKADCPRCVGGKGRIDAFSHVLGGVCFKCGGKGYVEVKTDPERLKAQREKRAAKRKAEMDARVAAANARIEARQAKYQNDPRIGPVWRERCARLEAVADETYRYLEAIDNGTGHPDLGDIAR